MKYQIIKHKNHEVSIIKHKNQSIKLLNKIMKYQIIKQNHEVSNY